MKGTKVQRKNILIILFLLFIATIGAATLSACANTTIEDDLIAQGYTCLVTYDANGGDFNSSPSSFVGTQDVRVKPGSLTVEPGYRPVGSGELNIVTKPEYAFHTFLYWELVEYDDEGNEIATREWNFKTDIVEEDITLRAVWKAVSVLRVNAIIDETEVNFRTFEIDESGLGQSFLSSLYVSDDGVYTLSPDNIVRSMSSVKVEINGQTVTYTPLSFYFLDENGVRTDLTADNAIYPSDAEEMVVYADFLEGEFDFITQEEIDRGRITLEEDSNWYLLEDIDLGQAYPQTDNPLDYSEAEHWLALDEFNGTIYGNNFTISNVWFTKLIASGDTEYSIFGEMNGLVEDLTFENVEFTVYANNIGTSTGATQVNNIAFLAGSFGADGMFDGVTLQGCSISIVNSSAGDAIKFNYTLADGNDYYWIGSPQAQQSVEGTILPQSKQDTNIDYIR